MRKLQPIPALAVVGALMVPLAFHPAAAAIGPCEEGGASSAEPFVACGRTTVVGPRGSTIRLHVPQETVLDLSTTGSPAAFRTAVLKGDGPMQGFLLTDNVVPSQGGKYVYVWHLYRGFSTVVQDHAEGNFEEDEGRFVIPPGDYSLYLISDGNPVNATLLFEGSPGLGSYEAGRTVLLDFRILGNHVSDPLGTGQQNVWSSGQAGTFRRPGFHALTWSAVGGLPDPGAAYGFCYYFGQPENEDTAYLPGCPNTISENVESSPVSGSGVYPDAPSQFFISAFSEPGGRAMGAWRAGAKPMETIVALSYFFEFDPAFTPGP